MLGVENATVRPSMYLKGDRVEVLVSPEIFSQLMKLGEKQNEKQNRFANKRKPRSTRKPAKRTV
jgi:hypothetical protein